MHLKKVGALLGDPSEFSVEDFRLELAELGLLGRAFGPEEYRVALEEHLGIEIAVEGVPDARGGAFVEEVLTERNLAEVAIEEESGNALILAREDLRYRPWPAYELGLFHELSHLAAGHAVRMKQVHQDRTQRRFRALGSRLARREPSSVDGGGAVKKDLLESEAKKRAKWLVLAGTCPKAFEAEKANRLT